MDFRKGIQMGIVAAVLLVRPDVARAEWFVSPFAALNTGGATTKESGTFGVSGGWMGRWLGAEGEAAWSPMFFDDDSGFRSKHRASTYTGTALVGPQLGMLRPYGAFGLGVLRSEIDEVDGLATVSDTRAALHAGGGVTWGVNERLAVRGDVRYIRALDDTEPEGNVFAERLGEFDFWRAGGGVVFQW